MLTRVGSGPDAHTSRVRRAWRLLRQLGPAGPIALAATILPFLGGVAFAAIVHPLAPWLRTHGLAALALFIIGFAILGGLALVPTYVNSILAGWVLGFTVGLPAALIGLLGAAMISYAIARRLSQRRVEELIRQHPRWKRVKHALVGRSTWRATWLVALVRLSPVLPFETTSVLLAIAGVTPVPFGLGTALGVIPRAAAVVFVAARAHSLDLRHSGGRWMLVAGLLATVVGALVIALISRHALKLAAGDDPNSAAPRRPVGRNS